MMETFLAIYLKVFVVLTPFFVLSMFIALTERYSGTEKRRLVVRTTATVLLVAMSVFFEGHWIFTIFGVTLEAFQIGAGTLLFLTAISLVQGSAGRPHHHDGSDPAVVPLAIPITIGPGAIGTFMVMGANVVEPAAKVVAAVAILSAILSVCVLLFLAGWIEQVLGRARLIVLSKLTGLLVASIAAQMIFTGIRHFLVP